MLLRSSLLFVCVLVLSAIPGCSGGEKDDVSKERLEQMAGGALKEVVPVSGKVMVDGTPERGVVMYLYASGGTNQVATCTTGENGEYCWSTYLSCDGVPPGDYQLGFSFIPNQKKNDEGVDVFKGKYRMTKDPKFALSVKSGAPMKDQNYELATK